MRRKENSMEETFIILVKSLPNGFPNSHLLGNISVGMKYSIIGKYMKSRQIIDDTGKDIWISGKCMKKFFKEVK